jgi:hypothetical protein
VIAPVEGEFRQNWKVLWQVAGVLCAVLGVATWLPGCANDAAGSTNLAAGESDGAKLAQTGELAAPLELYARRPFEPTWKERQNEELGDRRMLIRFDHLLDRSMGETRLVIEEGRIRCRRELFVPGVAREADVGKIYFRAESATPVAYRGLGACLTEPPFSGEEHSRVPANQMMCAGLEEKSLHLHGFSWPFERESSTDARMLSYRRMKVVASALEGSALPGEIYEMTHHGTDRTRAPVNEEASVMGVFFTVEDGEEGHEKWRPPMFVGSSGSIESSQVDALVEYVETDRQLERRAFARITPAWSMTVRYERKDDTQGSLHVQSLRERPRLRAIRDWAEALAVSGCSVGKVRWPVVGGG